MTDPWFQSPIAMDPAGKSAIQQQPWKHLQFDEAKWRIVIDDINLQVTKAGFNRKSELHRSIADGSKSLFKDNIRCTIESLPQNVQGYATNHAISPFTPVVLVVFTINRQLYFDKAGTRPADITHFVLPPKLLSVGFFVDDTTSTFKEGLKLKYASPSRSTDNHLYYLYLRQHGFVDEPFETWSSASKGGETVNNCYLLDLSAFKPRSTAANVTIRVQFDGVSPLGYNMMCLSPSESNYGHDKNGIWFADKALL